jgi:tRNA pseudouridine38-40 synthase
MMNRYFIEVYYKGTEYAGFQVQANAVTIQSELEKALKILLNNDVELTGSSRTDTGVHARQNYFHFDLPFHIDNTRTYNLNAILPADIAVRRIIKVDPECHSRFDAIAREYCYSVYRFKDPFLHDRAYYFPFSMDLELLKEASSVLLGTHDFTSYSKRNTQVKTFICTIERSEWVQNEHLFQYRVKGNRFLRGMVRGLVGTMLRVGRGQMTIGEFRNVLNARDCSKADFSVPGKGLCLEKVVYPEGYFERFL